MSRDNQVPDKTVLSNVNKKMAMKGTGSKKVAASVRGGDVTLTGTIAFEYERRAMLRSASSVPGVRRVIDQLRVEARKKRTQ